MRRIKTLKEYSEAAQSTCLASSFNFSHLAFGLIAEIGEVADLVAKWVRKRMAFIKNDFLVFNTSEEAEAQSFRDKIIKELGDVLWFVALLSEYLGVSFEELANRNIAKLAERKRANTIINHEDH